MSHIHPLLIIYVVLALGAVSCFYAADRLFFHGFFGPKVKVPKNVGRKHYSDLRIVFPRAVLDANTFTQMRLRRARADVRAPSEAQEQWRLQYSTVPTQFAVRTGQEIHDAIQTMLAAELGTDQHSLQTNPSNPEVKVKEPPEPPKSKRSADHLLDNDWKIK